MMRFFSSVYKVGRDGKFNAIAHIVPEFNLSGSILFMLETKTGSNE